MVRMNRNTFAYLFKKGAQATRYVVPWREACSPCYLGLQSGGDDGMEREERRMLVLRWGSSSCSGSTTYEGVSGTLRLEPERSSREDDISHGFSRRGELHRHTRVERGFRYIPCRCSELCQVPVAEGCTNAECMGTRLYRALPVQGRA